MKTSEEIFNEMTEEFETVTGKTISPECDMAVRMKAAATQIEALYVYGDWLLRQCFPQTADGVNLSNHASMRMITRKAATKASGTLSFSIPSALTHNVSIPSGTVCMTAKGVSFETTEEGVITPGSRMATVSARAVNAGREGNVVAGTINYMTNAPVGVAECTNLHNFLGGADEESDDELRRRVLEAYNTMSNGANSAWYEKTALTVEGVDVASAVPRARGIGTVDVVIAQNDGAPSQALIDAVQAKFEELREICVDVQVCAPYVAQLNFDVSLTVKTGYDFDAVKTEVENAISAVVAKNKMGRNIYTATISEAIFHVDGVENFKLNAPDFDYYADRRTYLIPGEITITRWMC